MKFCPAVPEICRGQVHAWVARAYAIDLHLPMQRELIKSPKQNLGDLLFLLASYYYFYFYYYYSFFPRSMNLSTADLRNYRTEFHETWWSYRYMFLVDPKVFRKNNNNKNKIKNNNKKRSKINKSPKLCLGDLIMTQCVHRTQILPLPP
jgi:hypothetical protein